MNQQAEKNKFLGCIYGLAIGDALGYPVEFLRLSEIKDLFGPEGITKFEKTFEIKKGLYSDDTQMALATLNALVNSKTEDIEEIMKNISQEYISWLVSQDNTRAPGKTCIQGVSNLKIGMPWNKSGIKDTFGCGAAMRTAPIGLYFNDQLEKLIEVARASSICTHANQTALASGIATAYLTSLAFNDEPPENLLERLINEGAKWDQNFTDKIRQVKSVLRDSSSDRALKELGEGWRGDEAVALGLYCFLKNPRDYKTTVLMAANTNGDSDSIACIAGAISGAYNGVEAIPKEWIRGVENTELLRASAEKLYQKSTGRVK